MAQIAVPTSDITHTSWTEVGDGDGSAFDELAIDDAATTRWESTVDLARIQCGIGAVTDPGVTTGHIASMTTWKSSGGGQQQDHILEFGSNLAQQRYGATTFVNVDGTLTIRSHTWDGVTGGPFVYNTVRIGCVLDEVGGGAGRTAIITYMQLEVPDASSADPVKTQDTTTQYELKHRKQGAYGWFRNFNPEIGSLAIMMSQITNVPQVPELLLLNTQDNLVKRQQSEHLGATAQAFWLPEAEAAPQRPELQVVESPTVQYQKSEGAAVQSLISMATQVPDITIRPIIYSYETENRPTQEKSKDTATQSLVSMASQVTNVPQVPKLQVVESKEVVYQKPEGAATQSLISMATQITDVPQRPEIYTYEAESRSVQEKSKDTAVQSLVSVVTQVIDVPQVPELQVDRQELEFFGRMWQLRNFKEGTLALPTVMEQITDVPQRYKPDLFELDKKVVQEKYKFFPGSLIAPQMYKPTYPQLINPRVTVVDTFVTSHPITMPPASEIGIGDLLVVIICYGYDVAISGAINNPDSTKWLSRSNDNNPLDNSVTRIWLAIANGTEGDTTVDFSTTDTCRATAHVYRAKAGTWAGWGLSTNILVNTSSATNQFPDPDPVNPPWALVNAHYSYIAGFTRNNAGFITVVDGPNNFSTPIYNQHNTAVCTCRRELFDTGEHDPTTFESSNEFWRAFTILIRPQVVEQTLFYASNYQPYWDKLVKRYDDPFIVSTVAALTAPPPEKPQLLYAGVEQVERALLLSRLDQAYAVQSLVSTVTQITDVPQRPFLILNQAERTVQLDRTKDILTYSTQQILELIPERPRSEYFPVEQVERFNLLKRLDQAYAIQSLISTATQVTDVPQRAVQSYFDRQVQRELSKDFPGYSLAATSLITDVPQRPFLVLNQAERTLELLDLGYAVQALAATNTPPVTEIPPQISPWLDYYPVLPSEHLAFPVSAVNLIAGQDVPQRAIPVLYDTDKTVIRVDLGGAVQSLIATTVQVTDMPLRPYLILHNERLVKLDRTKDIPTYSTQQVHEIFDVPQRAIQVYFDRRVLRELSKDFTREYALIWIIPPVVPPITGEIPVVVVGPTDFVSPGLIRVRLSPLKINIKNAIRLRMSPRRIRHFGDKE